MAGDWIKMRSNLWDDPRVSHLCDLLDCGEAIVVGSLYWLWSAADQHTEDGVMVGLSVARIDRKTGLPGFAQALCEIGWLEVTPDGVRILRFEEHNGASAKSRVETAKRVAKHRNKVREASGEAEAGIPRPIRAAVMERDKCACVYCGRKEGDIAPHETKADGILHVDHVIPRAQGGTNDLQNLVAACRTCNMFKGDRNPDECGMKWPLIDGQRAGNADLDGCNAKNVTGALAREREEKEKEKTDSVPNGTGGKPPKLTDPKEIIFGYGLTLLVNANVPEKNARSFLGGRVKEYEEGPVIDALRECAKAKPLQPLEWLAAALPPKGSPRASSKHAGFSGKNYREGVSDDGSFH